MSQRSNFGKYHNITAAAAETVIKAGPGILHKVIINKAVASGTLALFDGTDDTGTDIALVTLPATLLANQLVLPYECQFTDGLTMTMVQDMDVTFIYE